MTTRLFRFLIIPLLATFTISGALAQDAAKATAGPLKVLLVAGGCCHDYATQKDLLKAGIESRINAEVTVAFNPSGNTSTRFDVYGSANWADKYDVILHDECSANVTDVAYVNRILDAHRRGKPAVNIHCAMHCYRWGDFRDPVKLGAENAGWYEMIGLQSTGHGPQSPLDVSYVDAAHPLTQGLKSWTTVNEELYNNIQVFDTAHVLASGKQMQKPNKKALKNNPNAKSKESEAAIAWTNEYGPNKTKVFSTSLGHNNETVGDDRYLDLVVRGLLWTTGNLTDDGSPKPAYEK